MSASVQHRISDDEIREQLFNRRPTYAEEERQACYTRWRTGKKFDGCAPDCHCPRARFVTDDDVKRYRDERTLFLVKRVNELLAKPSEHIVDAGTMLLLEIERLDTDNGRKFVQLFNSSISSK